MNIFVTDNCPVISANRLADRHIVKMPLETAQMLSTAIQTVSNQKLDDIYKIAHLNHPCSVWVRESSGNFLWLYEHGKALCDEYTLRYGKIHAARKVIDRCYELLVTLSLENEMDYDMTPFAKAMPDIHKSIQNPTDAYKSYLKSKYSDWEEKKMLSYGRRKVTVSSIRWLEK